MRFQYMAIFLIWFAPGCRTENIEQTGKGEQEDSLSQAEREAVLIDALEELAHAGPSELIEAMTQRGKRDYILRICGLIALNSVNNEVVEQDVSMRTLAEHSIEIRQQYMSNTPDDLLTDTELIEFIGEAKASNHLSLPTNGFSESSEDIGAITFPTETSAVVNLGEDGFAVQMVNIEGRWLYDGCLSQE